MTLVWRVLNECRTCNKEHNQRIHDKRFSRALDFKSKYPRYDHDFVPVVVWELSEAEIKLLEAKKDEK
jgi:hypothetical protein